MKKSILKTYLIQFFLLLTLFFAFFVLNKMSYWTLALLVFIFSSILIMFGRRKKRTSIYEKDVTIMMTIFGLIYLLVFFLLGLVINNFARQPITFSFKTIYKFIIPLSVIIIFSEKIRVKLIEMNGKVRVLKGTYDFSKIITFCIMVLLDIAIYIGSFDLSNYNDFLTMLGFVLFSSISCNLLYTYIAKRYGANGIISFRLITTLYTYIIPIIPNIYIYFRTFLRMIYPYFLYLIFEKIFSQSDFIESRGDKKKNIISISILVIILTLITMLISCKFKYGILVIGSGSMTGTINIGDAIIFKEVDNKTIKEGDVMVFNKEGLKLIHRVIDIKKINGQLRYYTKGDANEKKDGWYVTEKEIIGITKIKIKYIGYPSIWFREIFVKKGEENV